MFQLPIIVYLLKLGLVGFLELGKLDVGFDLLFEFEVGLCEFFLEKLELALGFFKVFNDSFAFANIVGDLVVEGEDGRFGVVVGLF